MAVFTDFHPSAAGDSAGGGCNGEGALIDVQSMKHLHRALVACYECAGFLTARREPAKPPNVSPEYVQPRSVTSFYNPVAAFNKICNTAHSMLEMPK